MNRRRLAQLITCTILPLRSQKFPILSPQTIRKPGPDEMKKLVDQDEAEQNGVLEEFSLDDNSPLTDKARRIDRSPEVRVGGEELAPIRCQLRSN